MSKEVRYIRDVKVVLQPKGRTAKITFSLDGVNVVREFVHGGEPIEYLAMMVGKDLVDAGLGGELNAREMKVVGELIGAYETLGGFYLSKTPGAGDGPGLSRAPQISLGHSAEGVREVLDGWRGPKKPNPPSMWIRRIGDVTFVVSVSEIHHDDDGMTIEWDVTGSFKPTDPPFVDTFDQGVDTDDDSSFKEHADFVAAQIALRWVLDEDESPDGAGEFRKIRKALIAAGVTEHTLHMVEIERPFDADEADVPGTSGKPNPYGGHQCVCPASPCTIGHAPGKCPGHAWDRGHKCSACEASIVAAVRTGHRAASWHTKWCGQIRIDSRPATTPTGARAWEARVEIPPDMSGYIPHGGAMSRPTTVLHPLWVFPASPKPDDVAVGALLEAYQKIAYGNTFAEQSYKAAMRVKPHTSDFEISDRPMPPVGPTATTSAPAAAPAVAGETWVSGHVTALVYPSIHSPKARRVQVLLQGTKVYEGDHIPFDGSEAAEHARHNAAMEAIAAGNQPLQKQINRAVARDSAGNAVWTRKNPSGPPRKMPYSFTPYAQQRSGSFAQPIQRKIDYGPTVLDLAAQMRHALGAPIEAASAPTEPEPVAPPAEPGVLPPLGPDMLLPKHVNGRPVYYKTAAGNQICARCANEIFEERAHDLVGWGFNVHNQHMSCTICNQRIEPDVVDDTDGEDPEADIFWRISGRVLISVEPTSGLDWFVTFYIPTTRGKKPGALTSKLATILVRPKYAGSPTDIAHNALSQAVQDFDIPEKDELLKHAEIDRTANDFIVYVVTPSEARNLRSKGPTP